MLNISLLLTKFKVFAMNESRRKRLLDLVYSHSVIEEERLAGTHKSRLSIVPFDRRRNAYNFDVFNQGGVSSVLITKHDRFSETPLHYHSHIELNLMLSGQCRQVIGNQEVVLQPGTIVLVDTNTPHALSLAGEDDLLINVALNKDYLSRYLVGSLPPGNLLTTFIVNAVTNGSRQMNYLVFSVGENDRLRCTLDELLFETFFPSDMHDVLVEQLLQLAMIDMLQGIDSQVILQQLRGGNLAVAEALEWIDSHYVDCTLEEAARVVGMSATYLTSLLKRTVGMSFSQLVISKRMAHARERVLSSDVPIEQIAHECGYENLSFFYRKFREAHGCNPNELRGRMR